MFRSPAPFGSPGSRKYECRLWTPRDASTDWQAAQRPCPSSWPPNNRGYRLASGMVTPRKKSTCNKPLGILSDLLRASQGEGRMRITTQES